MNEIKGCNGCPIGNVCEQNMTGEPCSLRERGASMKVIYVSGKYRGDVDANIEHARQAAIRLWQNGWIVLCPHLNSVGTVGGCTDDMFLTGDLELLSRCDCIFMLNNYKSSVGALKELALAKELGLDIFYEMETD